MKKLSKIAFATLAGLAMIVSATSCVQIHAADEPMGDLKDQYVRGSMNNWANDNIEDGALTKNEDGTYSFIFKATAETEEFGVADKDWSSKYSKGEVKAGGEYSVIEVGSGLENAKITDLTAGEVYTMTIIAGAESLKIKVELGGELESAGYDALPFYLDGYFVQSCPCINDTPMNADQFTIENYIKNGVLDKETMEVVYEYTFKCTGSTDDWHKEASAAIQIVKDDWSLAYNSKVPLEVGSDFVELTLVDNGDKNTLVKGLNKNCLYKMEIKTTSDEKVFVKIYEVLAITLQVKVTGLTGAENGQTAVINGAWSNWSGWNTCWGGSKKVSELTHGTIKDGVAVITVLEDFAVSVGDTFSYEGCGYYGVEKDDDIKDAKGKIKLNDEKGQPELNFKIEFVVDKGGLYVTTVDLSNQTVSTAFSE